MADELKPDFWGWYGMLSVLVYRGGIKWGTMGVPTKEEAMAVIGKFEAFCKAQDRAAPLPPAPSEPRQFVEISPIWCKCGHVDNNHNAAGNSCGQCLCKGFAAKSESRVEAPAPLPSSKTVKEIQQELSDAGQDSSARNPHKGRR